MSGSGGKTPFLHMFPCCEGIDISGGIANVHVLEAVLNRERLTLEINARFPERPSPSQLFALEGRISAELGMRAVSILPDSSPTKPAEGSVMAEKAKKPAAKSRTGRVLYGGAIKGRPQHMGMVSQDSGSVIVSGRVFASDSRVIQKTSAHVLSFDITDDTGSLHVSKYIKKGDDASVIAKIKPGMYLTVQGTVAYNRYDEDIAIEPRSIAEAEAPRRLDSAAEKRVELHLHTRFSAQDALTDPSEAVRLAGAWGHRAIAITDHGVAQAFPEVWSAGKKNGVKIIYGVEGYLLNDVDDALCVTGRAEGTLDEELVVFDIETTGLDADTDRITEIGAVIYKGEDIIGRFQTFANPEMPIPREITELTGITDRDVFDAPSQGEAVRAFLDFAGGRPLCAHNSPFDTGFIDAACRENGIAFEPAHIDTLALSRALLPELGRYKLNLVSDHLGLPRFTHHRASDDAAACARLFGRLRERLKQQGVKTLGEINASLSRMGARPKREHTRHIILLVKNKTGLKNLYKLISKSHLEHFKKNPIIPKSLLLRYREGLIVGSACEAGEVFDAIVRKRSRAEQKRLAEFYDYLEIQPLCNNRFLIDNGAARSEDDLREYNRRVLRLGDELKKPVVATGDVHFLNPDDEIYRHILLAAKKYADADKPLPVYFKTTDEMLTEFAYLGLDRSREVVITNTNLIADMCEEIELLPKGLFPPRIENSVDELKSLVYGRMSALYGESPPDTIKNRVETELSDIIGCHYDVIYMSAQKLVAKSLEAGYLVGSRGSVGSSVVAFLAGITEVNALPAHYRCPKCKKTDFESGKGFGCGADMPDANCPACGAEYVKDGFDIPFETFLGFGGDKVPDIDLNFSGEYQALAHKHTNELFGADHVFRAGTIGTLADKTAYGYVKKYLEERGRVVTKSEENRLSAGLVGVKRTTGQHPGGLVIIPQDMEVEDFCPVQRPADDTGTDIITTHFEYHSMEDNLLKLDILGHDDPTMIKMLEDMTSVKASDIPLGDPDTMSIFKSPEKLGLCGDDPVIGRTGTIGIPEFGTGFTRQMLVDTEPQDFDTLVRLSGFSHGTDVWAGNIRELILSGTAAVKETVGCRDDIMLYLISKGMDERLAFRFMEDVRKGVIHKGKSWPEGIVEQMRSLGVPDWYIESCRKIQYLFPKAHAVAYVMMAFRIAWFKVHEPLAFYSAYFYRRSQKDSFDASIMTRGLDAVCAKIKALCANQSKTAKEEDLLTTLEACYEFYKRGFDFAPIDLYESDAVKFLISGKTLRPPFVAIPGLGETAANDIADNRRGREFVSMEDLAATCRKVSKAHIEQLRALGALRDMPETSQISLFF